MDKIGQSVKVQFIDSNNEYTGYYIPLDTLQPMAHGWIAAMMQPGKDGTEEAANMARLMKTAVKGVLIMYGDKLLTLMLGKGHPKPPKGSDIVEWYTGIFAQVALALASKQVYTVQVEDSFTDDYQKVSGLTTVPIQEGDA